MTFLRILLQPYYAALALLASLAAFLFLSFSANVGILQSAILGGGIPFAAQAGIMLSIPYGYVIEPSQQSALMFTVAALFGVNLAFVIYYIHLYKASALSTIALLGTGSITSAIIGMACLSCGSIIFAFLGTIFGASSLLLALPISGAGFSFASMGLSAFSIWLIWKKIRQSEDQQEIFKQE